MGKLPSPTSIPFISTVHRAFYEQMPAEFRFLERPDGTKAEIVPGAFRAAPEEDVTVGRHRPPAPDRVAAFMEHFARRFAAAAKSARTRIIAITSRSEEHTSDTQYLIRISYDVFCLKKKKHTKNYELRDGTEI